MTSSAYVDALTSTLAWPTDQTVTYAFAAAGTATDKGDYAGGSDTTIAWSETEKGWVREVYDQISALTGMTFRAVSSTSSSDVDFQLVENVPGGWAGFADYPSTYYGSTVVIGTKWVAPTDGNTTVHEMGHSMGLDHPHEGVVFPGVTDAYDPGENNLNNALFSTMSYNSPYDPEHPDLSFDTEELSFMAFDIAALQAMYGANTATATGDDTYGMTTRLASIWDAGGTDSIDFSAATGDAVINLHAATLENAPGGGGYLSFVHDPESSWSESTKGGYTIANGVDIEDAHGGAGNDEIIGNAGANVLSGHVGMDTLLGLNGNDTLLGGNGDDDLDGGRNLDLLKGGKGRDTLFGGKGKDDLSGGSGGDRLKGGQHADTLAGGEGSDKITGGGGDDRIVFAAGHGKDRFTDFEANDILELDADLWTGTKSAAQVVSDYSGLDGDDILLLFDGGEQIRFKGIIPDFTDADAAMAAIQASIEIV